jgi:hypothetical protein
MKGYDVIKEPQWDSGRRHLAHCSGCCYKHVMPPASNPCDLHGSINLPKLFTAGLFNAGRSGDAGRLGVYPKNPGDRTALTESYSGRIIEATCQRAEHQRQNNPHAAFRNLSSASVNVGTHLKFGGCFTDRMSKSHPIRSIVQTFAIGKGAKPRQVKA